ncbi:hypothetical protein FQN55_009248 [Onygenales sp. PD_40]|nr:hypothetical protein FQN55_009248 [Onygenales sp. PD_40]KAK2773568.1 hypothetical protein FQN53_004106 [Emmonsiellopsis sp. PD_33]KAK2781375.1 hypothetical protein FQN52_001668 [Onygenales sp. PD_12]KAK2798673.1 hypothetical protein FQN51_007535 [Onygenales sp. PD_10]
MAAPRLPFLYPNLLRSVRACEPTTYRSIRFPPPQQHHSQSSSPHAAFHTSHRREAETYHQRYGQAAEPRLPPPPRPKDAPSAEAGPKPDQEPAAKKADKSGEQDVKESGKQSQAEAEKSQASVTASSTNISAELPSQQGTAGRESAQSDISASAQSATGAGQDMDPLQGTIQGHSFQMPGPATSLTPADGNISQSSTADSENRKPPHLSPPLYVHHFDTYSLVKDLGRSGFTEEQSVSIMKAIRGLLADNLDIARGGLVSKSDVENETYLFQAACSELRNSLQASRNAEIQSQRTQRAQLQHEVDILTQRMTQELAGLKDDLKEMFNDQKISTRELQRSLDTAIQELNYQITVSLNSDGKSEVEGLRWILTRRAALAIATSAGMIILALRYSSYKHHEKELAKGAAAEAKAAPPPPSSEFGLDPALNNARPESSVTEPLG